MPLILGTNSIKDTGYDVANSLRFNDGSQDSLSRTPSSAGNRRTWTWSSWIKRSALGTYQYIFAGGSANTWVAFLDTDKFQFNIQDNDESTITTTQLFRDVSSWYHIVAAIDTTQGTASNRVKVYVNGSQVTDFSTEVYPSQNYQAGINNTGIHYLGRLNYAATSWFDGYMAETVLIDGQQLEPTSFGEFDEDSPTIWKPKDVSGLTFGTNGFYLDFENSGSLGADVSGNSNNFTVNNLTSIDQSTDTCTNNFATLNPLNLQTSNPPTFSEGNLSSITSSNGSSKWGGCSTIGMTSGKFYCEAKATVDSTSRNVIGITGDSANLARTSGTILNTTHSWGYYSSDGSVAGNGGGNESGYGTSYTTGDIIGIALDLDNNKLYFSKNGVFLNSGDPTSGASGTGAVSIIAASATNDGAYFFAQSDDTSGSAVSKFEFNFGSPPYSESGGNSDANGYGNFAGSVPSGYFAINTKNLAEFG